MDFQALLVRQSTVCSRFTPSPKIRWKSIKEGTRCELLAPTNMYIHTHVHATVSIYIGKTSTKRHSWADRIYKDPGLIRRGLRLGSRVGLSSIQALLFAVWEATIWNQVHHLTSQTQFFLCKMVPSCQTQWNKVKGHLEYHTSWISSWDM